MAGRFAFGDSILNIAKWDGSRWRPVGLGVTGTVRTMAIVGDRLYAAGTLTAAGGMPVNNIAVWDGNDWNRLGTEASNGTSGTIYSMLAAPDGSLIVAGDFITAGEVFSDNIARWKEDTWSSIPGTNGPIYRLHRDGSTLYVGGSFARADAASVNNVATYDLASGAWDNFHDGVTGSPSATVRGIATLGNDLFVGGEFPYAGTTQSWNFARFGFVASSAETEQQQGAGGLHAIVVPNPAVGNGRCIWGGQQRHRLCRQARRLVAAGLHQGVQAQRDLAHRRYWARLSALRRLALDPSPKEAARWCSTDRARSSTRGQSA